MEDVLAPPTPLLTHIALPVRDLEATLAWYRKYTTLEVIHERQDLETKLRTAWLANPGDRTDAGGDIGVQAATFVIVLIAGKLPTNITGDIKEEYGFLTSISHLGLSPRFRARTSTGWRRWPRRTGACCSGRCTATSSSATSAW